MKEKGKQLSFLVLALWMVLSFFPLPTMAVEAEVAMAEGLSAQQTGKMEWIALVFSSVWALIMQVFRLRK